MQGQAAAIEAAVNCYQHALDDCLVLNAARNFISRKTRAVLGSGIADGNWSGSSPSTGGPHSSSEIAHILAQTCALTRDLLAYPHAELRTPSGSIANRIAIASLSSLNRKILVPPKWAFGHKSVHVDASELPWDGPAMQPDLGRLRLLLRQSGPAVMVFGTSRPLFPEPFDELKAIADETGSTLVYDGAHVLGLIAGQVFPNPLLAGFDILTGSTHKTFPGPMGGLVVCRTPEQHRQIVAVTDRWLSTFSVSRVAALAVAMTEFIGSGKIYATRVVENARTLAQALHAKGFQVVALDRGFTSTHQVLLDLTNLSVLPRLPEILAAAHILVNPPARVDNRLRGASTDGVWLRLGTAACTRLGMGQAAMVEIAEILSELLMDRKNPEELRRRVKDLNDRYPTVIDNINQS